MRVLLHSTAFAPRLGGQETFAALLAGGLAARGDEVVVLTETPLDEGPADEREARPYRVVRRPRWRERLGWVRWCQVFFQANVSLRGLWPLLLVPRPWVVSHHSWYCRTDGRIAWQDRLKRRLVHRAAASIAVSRAVARDLDTGTVVIGNPYRDDLFRTLPGFERDRELIFVGRLVSDKGADVLLDALGRLAREGGPRPRLTLVGDGPEAPALRRQVAELDLAGQVSFVGVRTGGALVDVLNRHRILVVPSRYHEPFGIVALEGIACGCAVVGSAGGGLPEAMGSCGLTFPNGDADALARVLARLLAGPQELAALRQGAEEHLARHRVGPVVEAYRRQLERAIASDARSGES